MKRRRVAIGIIWAAWAVQAAWADNETRSPASPALGSDEITEPQLRASLSVLETMRQALIGVRAKVPAILSGHTTDDRGRTFADDWDAYCLNDADQADIGRQFASMTAALDAADLKSANNQRQALYHRLQVVGIQCKCIGDYWQEVVAHSPNWSPYLSMLRENDVEPHYAANIASLERTLKLQARHGLFIDAIGGTLTQMEAVRAHGQQLDLKELERKAMNSDFHGLYATTPATSCAPVAGRISEKQTPSWDYSQSQPKLTYPEEARRNREHGRVYLGLIVQPTGCVRTAFVLVSSGFERLDRAAVSYAMALRFLPGQEHGVAIEALAVTPVNFTLQSP